MGNDRKSKRKGKPKKLKTLLQEKKTFNLLPKDPLTEFIDATFRAKYTASSMDITGNVPKKTEKGYDPKIFFHGTVFEEMFYPRPPGLSDIEEAFLNHPALDDAKVCKCLRSRSNVTIGNVRDEQVASVPEVGNASSRVDWNFLVKSVASLKVSGKEDLLRKSGLTEGVRKRDRPSSWIAVNDSAKKSQPVDVKVEDIVVSDSDSDIIFETVVKRVTKATSYEHVMEKARETGNSDGEKVKPVLPGTSKTANAVDDGGAEEDIVRLKSMSSMMSEKLEWEDEANVPQDSLSEEEEERELTSHESDTSSSGSVSSVCEVVFQKRVIVPDVSDTTRSHIAKLIKDKFNMTPSPFKKTPVRARNQDNVEPKSKKAVVDPECMVIEDPPHASGDSDVIVLSD